MKKVIKNHISDIPNIFIHHSSKLLIMFKKGSSIEMGYYNEHSDINKSGFYNTRNFDQKVKDAINYTIAPLDLNIRCSVCKNIFKVNELKPFLRKNTSYQIQDCCPICEAHTGYEYIGYHQEEE